VAPANAPGPSGIRIGAALRPVLALASFAAELAMLALLAVSGWGLGDGGLLGIALAVLYPAVAVLAWSLWMAPRSRRRLGEPWRFLAEAALFAGTAGAGVAAGHPGWATAFVCVAVGTFGLVRAAGEADAQAGSRSS
jgi:hypothetical protein